jgi:hypothetical protein
VRLTMHKNEMVAGVALAALGQMLPLVELTKYQALRRLRVVSADIMLCLTMTLNTCEIARLT